MASELQHWSTNQFSTMLKTLDNGDSETNHNSSNELSTSTPSSIPHQGPLLHPPAGHQCSKPVKRRTSLCITGSKRAGEVSEAVCLLNCEVGFIRIANLGDCMYTSGISVSSLNGFEHEFSYHCH